MDMETRVDGLASSTDDNQVAVLNTSAIDVRRTRVAVIFGYVGARFQGLQK